MNVAERKAAYNRELAIITEQLKAKYFHNDEDFYTGIVKWFNVERGYGFISLSDSKDDVFVTYQEIITDGFKALHEGEIVSFNIYLSNRGEIAKNVKVIK